MMILPELLLHHRHWHHQGYHHRYQFMASPHGAGLGESLARNAE
jgi:hypothetical protein